MDRFELKPANENGSADGAGAERTIEATQAAIARSKTLLEQMQDLLARKPRAKGDATPI